MPYKRSYRKPAYKPRRKLQQQAIVPRRAGGFIANAARVVPHAVRAAGAIVQGVRQGLQLRNQIVANRNRNVKYRNERKAAKGVYPKDVSQADMLPVLVHKFKLTNAPLLPRRQLKLGFNGRTLRWQRINNMNAAGTFAGNLPLSHTTVNTDQTRSPMFFFLLNQSINQGTLTQGPANYVDFDNTGNVIFTQLNSQNTDLTTTQAKWNFDDASPYPIASTTDPDYRYIMNAWYDIRLNCYGATSQPTVYDIMIISFMNTYCDPYEIPSSTQEIADRHNLYQEMAHKYMSNPILPAQMHQKKKYRVHKHIRFTLQPTLNTELDTSPQSKIVKIFAQDNSLYDYCYHGDGFSGVGADDKLSTAQYTVQGRASIDYSDNPIAKARKWLVVRALNTTRSATESSANTPSFDIIVRKREYTQAR